MPMIDWNDTLCVHVAEIDRQHLGLIRMLNDLHEAMLTGKSRQVLGRLIAQMSDYAATHFAFEESHFRESGYPEAARHEKMHAEFAAKVSEFEAAFEQGALALSMEILDFLTDWLVTHIQGMDREYIVALREKALL